MAIFRFDNLNAPMASRSAFLGRLDLNILVAFGLIGIALGAGMYGYHQLEKLTWLDAFLNSAMLLGGMGPVDTMHTDAGKLFEATLAQNPNNRDALFNVAVTYLSMEQNEKVGPIVERLVAVDPGNPENYNLAARAYLSLGKVAKTAKKPAVAAAYNDTTVTWFTRGNNLPIEVTFTEFSPNDKAVTIGGSILDRRDKIEANNPPAAAPPKVAKGARGKSAPASKVETKTLPPKPVTLAFSAIDKSGQVVGTETVTTEPLAPGQKAKFKIIINAPNVLAYRYKIVD